MLGGIWRTCAVGMFPASKRAKAGQGSEEAPPEPEEPEECCVCFNEFGSGPRTKVHSFDCNGGQLHAICRACDKTLFMRNDDKCPTCRAERSDASIAAGGYRPAPPPRERPIPAGFGGMMFFPVDSDEPDLFMGMVPAGSDMGLALTSGFQNAVRNRNSRFAVSHPALAPPDTSGDAVIAAALSDPAIAAAMDGLTNPAGMDIRSFLAAVHGAGSSSGSGSHPVPIPQQARRGHRHRQIHPALAVDDDDPPPPPPTSLPMAVLPNRPRPQQYL